jgi:hypothetical protein
MDLHSFNRRELAFVVGVPIAWAVLLLFHPGGDGTAIYADLKENVPAMMAVHVGMMIFVPLFAAAIFLLLRGNESAAAKLARAALVPYVVLYVAWEALQGIANAVLTDKVNALPAAQQGIGAGLIQDFAESPLVRDMGVLVIPASVALVIASVALGTALRDAGAPRSAPALFGIAGFLITAHPPPYGPAGLALFAATVVYLTRGHRRVKVRDTTQPTPT